MITLAFIRFGQFQNEMMTYFVVVLFNYFLTFACAVNSLDLTSRFDVTSRKALSSN